MKVFYDREAIATVTCMLSAQFRAAAQAGLMSLSPLLGKVNMAIKYNDLGYASAEEKAFIESRLKFLEKIKEHGLVLGVASASGNANGGRVHEIFAALLKSLRISDEEQAQLCRGLFDNQEINIIAHTHKARLIAQYTYLKQLKHGALGITSAFVGSSFPENEEAVSFVFLCVAETLKIIEAANPGIELWELAEGEDYTLRHPAI